jgi:pimeloyl-ACP methyl ester carboxylesterase
LLSAELQAQLRATPSADYAHLLDELAAQYAYRRAWGGETFTPQIGARYLLEWLQAGPEWTRMYRIVTETDLAACLPRLHQPTLVMCARSDRLWERSQQAVQLIPNAHFVEMKDVSTNVLDERPAAFAGVVDEFLQRSIHRYGS